MSYPGLVIVGYTAEAVDNVWEILEEPKPPKTHKKPETIKKWETEDKPGKMEEIADAARFRPVTGQISRVCAVDLTSMDVLDTDEAGGVPAVAFWSWLQERYPDAFAAFPRDDKDPEVLLAGFDVAPFRQIVAWQANNLGESVPVGFWLGTSNCFDPYHLLINSATHRDQLPLWVLAEQLEVDVYEDYGPHMYAEQDLRLATEMVLRLNLYQDRSVEESLRALVASPAEDETAEELADATA